MQFSLLKKLLLFSLLVFFSSCSLNNTNNLSNAWDPIEPVNRAVNSSSELFIVNDIVTKIG